MKEKYSMVHIKELEELFGTLKVTMLVILMKAKCQEKGNWFKKV